MGDASPSMMSRKESLKDLKAHTQFFLDWNVIFTSIIIFVSNKNNLLKCHSSGGLNNTIA